MCACLPRFGAQDLVIDQTLYWKVIAREDDAWFLVAVLNSRALTNAITPFNPKGSHGERHIHALPYHLMPAFDAENDDHVRIATLGREVATTVLGIVEHDAYLDDPNRPLHIRRTKLRQRLAQVPEMKELERLAAAALGTTPVS